MHAEQGQARLEADDLDRRMAHLPPALASKQEPLLEHRLAVTQLKPLPCVGISERLRDANQPAKSVTNDGAWRESVQVTRDDTE